MSLTPEEKLKVLRQADAIRRLQQLPKAGLNRSQSLKFESGYSNGIEVTSASNTNPEAWLQRLEHDCFWPLIQQGYEKYVEALNRIAETGEI